MDGFYAARTSTITGAPLVGFVTALHTPPVVEVETPQVVALRKLAAIAGDAVKDAFALHVEAKAPIEKLQEIVFGASAEVAKVVAVKAANPGVTAPPEAKESVEDRRRKADAKFNQWPIPKA